MITIQAITNQKRLILTRLRYIHIQSKWPIQNISCFNFFCFKLKPLKTTENCKNLSFSDKLACSYNFDSILMHPSVKYSILPGPEGDKLDAKGLEWIRNYLNNYFKLHVCLSIHLFFSLSVHVSKKWLLLLHRVHSVLSLASWRASGRKKPYLRM